MAVCTNVNLTVAMFEYHASESTVVYLINQTMNGSPERRLAASLILDCLRKYQTREEIAECFAEIENKALLNISEDLRRMAAELGLGKR
jgi:hypothetical protein